MYLGVSPCQPPEGLQCSRPLQHPLINSNDRGKGRPGLLSWAKEAVELLKDISHLMSSKDICVGLEIA